MQQQYCNKTIIFVNEDLQGLYLNLPLHHWTLNLTTWARSQYVGQPKFSRLRQAMIRSQSISAHSEIQRVMEAVPAI